MTISRVLAAAVVVAGTAVGLASPAYAEDGPFPGGTAKTLTLTVDGVSVVTDLTKKVQTPASNATHTSASSRGGVLSGSVELDGSLPPGWTVYVWANAPANIVLQPSSSGDSFGGVGPPFAGFDNLSGVGAYICQTSAPCNSPAGQANLNIKWNA